MDRLTFEIIEPNKTADAAVIWLHGLGADGYDFMPIVPQLELSDLAIRFILPHAPHRPVSLAGGMVMPAWFDINEISLHTRYDITGVKSAAQQISVLIHAEHQKGISYHRIVLVGFSQGGVLSLCTALHFPHLLAGAMGLSTFLPQSGLLASLPVTRALPIFLAHGRSDHIVPIHLGEETKEFLQAQNYKISWHTYAMDHQVCAQEIVDISQWLRKTLSAT